MSDIRAPKGALTEKRLRERADALEGRAMKYRRYTDWDTIDLLRTTADEIERLRAALRRITETVEKNQAAGVRISPLTEQLEAIAYRAVTNGR